MAGIVDGSGRSKRFARGEPGIDVVRNPPEIDEFFDRRSNTQLAVARGFRSRRAETSTPKQMLYPRVLSHRISGRAGLEGSPIIPQHPDRNERISGQESRPRRTITDAANCVIDDVFCEAWMRVAHPEPSRRSATNYKKEIAARAPNRGALRRFRRATSLEMRGGALKHRLRRQLARHHRVVNPLGAEAVDESAGIADQHHAIVHGPLKRSADGDQRRREMLPGRGAGQHSTPAERRNKALLNVIGRLCDLAAVVIEDETDTDIHMRTLRKYVGIAMRVSVSVRHP